MLVSLQSKGPMKTPNFCRLIFPALLFLVASLAVPARAASADVDWSVVVLDRILAAVPPGQRLAQVGDMMIPATNLLAWRNWLAGVPSQQSAFSGSPLSPTWTGGNVYYEFTTSGSNAVSAVHQKAFQDCAAEWAMFANLHFIPHTTESNFVTVQESAGLEGGQSTVGMMGGQQFLQISPDAWNHGTICHEIGHTLGLVHEHQRSDRDMFVIILTNNIATGGEGNFVLLSDSKNQGAYDFESIMHYSRNQLSTNTAVDTIEPQPAFSQFLNLMGQGDPILTPLDRAGMVAVYGAGPAIGPVVTNTQDSGPGSLRAALYYAFDHPGTTIRFNIATNDPGFSNNAFSIQPSDRFPSLINATLLDGSTEPGNLNPNGPAIVLSGAQIGPDLFPNGLRFRGTNCVARSLVINGFPSSGVLLDGTNTTGNTVAGCYLGINATGTSAVPNGLPPVSITNGASGNTIGGLTAASRNIISGSVSQGIAIRDAGTQGNVVEGNYIGLNAAGTAALPNQLAGMEIFNGAQSNIIGGTQSGARNVISGNTLQGIFVSDAGTTGNVIEGNYIGLNAAGTASIGNGFSGIEIGGGAQSNVIGGVAPGSANVISGNTLQGVLIDGINVTGNRVEGNYIGLGPGGVGAIGNGEAGVNLAASAQGNFVGGPAAGNFIGGNHNQGVLIRGAGSSGNFVAGNLLGLDANGNAQGNSWSGLEISGGALSNIVGGTSEPMRNFISGNGNQGILIGGSGTVGNLIEGNYIGLSLTGISAVGNTWSAVEINNGAEGNIIGGIVGARNYLSGNGNYGVYVHDTNTSFNVIQGNSIGLNAAGNSLPNTFAGVALANGAQSNQVGGVTLGAANFLADNLLDGVQFFDPGTTGNPARGNSIFGNSGVGIGVYNGADDSIGAPTLASAVLTTNVTVSGSLNGSPSTTYHLDFYANPSSANPAQAMTYLGAVDATTGAGGAAAFSTNVALIVPAGQIITATATDPAGNTSSLSEGVAVSTVDSVGDGISDAWRAAHFGGNGMTTNSQSCATCDPDHDGFANMQEFLSGTDPNNAASALRIGTPNVSATNATVSFSSVQGIVYRVEARDDVAAGFWFVMADQIEGTGGTVQIIDPGAGKTWPRRFYRVDVLH